MTKITLTKPKITVDGKPLDLSQPAAPDTQTLAAPLAIDLTPTWSGLLLALVAVLQSGSAEGQAIALDELRRMAALADSVKRMTARADKAEAERDELRAAIFGSPDYAPDLRNGNFREMAETLHAARAGAVERAEIAESKLNLTNYTLTQETAFEIVGALQAAADRMDAEDEDGNPDADFQMVEGALARLYALPGLLDAMDPNAAGDEE